MCCTQGHPATYNDKTLANHDPLLLGLRDGKFLQDLHFDLYCLVTGEDGMCRVGTRRWRGAWVLSDNGYHPAWSCCIPPFKRPKFKTEARFSEWLESMRKDVECFFGLLKGRFRILKTGVRMQGVAVCDAIFKTYVALHNILLEWDGGDEEWRGGGVKLPLSTADQYSGDFGRHDTEDFVAAQKLRSSGNGQIPALFGRLFAEAANLDEEGFRDYDAGADADIMRVGIEETEPLPVHQRRRQLDLSEPVHQVCTYHRDVFRNALVEHWDLAWRKREVVWPSRLGTKPLSYHDPF